MKKAFISWSGGKDSCYSLFLANSRGFKVSYLLNMINEDGMRSRSHGLSVEILQAQSKALGIPLVQQKATWDEYESKFKEALHGFKKEGIEAGIFGDIDFNAHREWVDRVCNDAALTPELPLWGMDQDKIVREFIGSGFEAIIVAAKADYFGKETAGQRLDLDFINSLPKLGVTPCGEAGEYHTLVVNGPLFKKKIVIEKADIVSHDGLWFLDIKKCGLKDK